EDSYTTRENIEGANFIIQKIGTRLGIYARHVTIFCEAQRALKVALIARHYFSEPGRVQIETVSWELAHPRREIISTLKELVGLKVPLFARYLHHQRLKQAAVI
ncbi:MAG: hypothetical protein Q8P35_03320, partial [Candidatus Yanofskybacteria bacterium]|nr:hypothetical protein [Candidatus Yanofskybacteria bacterium]